MNASAPVDVPCPGRDRAIDALRAGTTLLVVLHHTAINYGAIGGWYTHEIATDRSPSSMALVFFCTLNQAWFMGLFFLLAGHYVAGPLQAKGHWRWLRDRLLRLGLPLLVYGFVIGPATIALAQTANGRPFVDTLLGLWSRGVFEKGPLWFAWALLLLALPTMALHRPLIIGNGLTQPHPSNRAMLAAALGTGVAAFALRLAWPVGTEVAGLQLGYFASYLLLYTVGGIGSMSHWLEDWPREQVRTWRRIAWAALPVLPLVALLGPRWGLAGRAEGGFSVLAAVYALWEPLVAFGVILGLLQACRERFATLGPFGQRLARRAFAIYVIHPPVVVGVSLAWRSVAAPALLKFAVTGAVACALCYLVAGALLRVPGLRRIL